MAGVIMQASGVLYILPWGGPTARVASALKVDAPGADHRAVEHPVHVLRLERRLGFNPEAVLGLSGPSIEWRRVHHPAKKLSRVPS